MRLSHASMVANAAVLRVAGASGATNHSNGSAVPARTHGEGMTARREQQRHLCTSPRGVGGNLRRIGWPGVLSLFQHLPIGGGAPNLGTVGDQGLGMRPELPAPARPLLRADALLHSRRWEAILSPQRLPQGVTVQNCRSDCGGAPIRVRFSGTRPEPVPGGADFTPCPVHPIREAAASSSSATWGQTATSNPAIRRRLHPRASIERFRQEQIHRVLSLRARRDLACGRPTASWTICSAAAVFPLLWRRESGAQSAGSPCRKRVEQDREWPSRSASRGETSPCQAGAGGGRGCERCADRPAARLAGS